AGTRDPAARFAAGAMATGGRFGRVARRLGPRPLVDPLGRGYVQGFLIRGGRALAGCVRVGGAKNAALPLLAATVLAAGRFRFQRVPDIRDVRVMCEILRSLGAEVVYHPAEAGHDAELIADTSH